jgi:ABC-type nitrate/sulfonate/bicarbonate transport system substrate-binding protein
METVRWGSPPVGLFNFPLDLWREQGGFARAGIRLEPRSHLTGEEYGAQIRAGTYDMGHIGTPVFLPAALGSREYAVVSVGICDFAPFYLVGAPGVAGLGDCRGERLVINKRLTCPGSLLAWHASHEGMDPGDFSVLELMREARHDNYGRAFLEGARAGDFRIGILYEPYVSAIERELGWSVLADYPALLRPANYGLLLYARREWVAQRPELVRATMAQYFAAAAHAREHPQLLRPYARALEFVQGADLERAIARDAPHWRLTPGADPAFLARVRDELVTQGRVPADFRIEDYVSLVH